SFIARCPWPAGACDAWPRVSSYGCLRCFWRSGGGGASHGTISRSNGIRPRACRQPGFGKHGVAVGRQLVETFSARVVVPWRSRGRAFGTRGVHSTTHRPGGTEGILCSSCRRREF